MKKLLALHAETCGSERTDNIIDLFGHSADVLKWAIRCDLENRGITH